MNAGENEYWFDKNDRPQGKDYQHHIKQGNSIETKNPQSEMGNRRCVSVCLDVQIRV